MANWNKYIPFYIRLRSYLQSGLPRPELFPALIAPMIADAMPRGWVHATLKSGNALVLVDGVDEVPVSQREEVHTWLSDLVEILPVWMFSRHFPLACHPERMDEPSGLS